jgi:hypothetical protein
LRRKHRQGTQGEVGQSSGTRNGITNPNPETPAKPDEMKGQQQGRDEEEVLVEDITNQPKSEGEEDDTETRSRPIYIGKKIKVQDAAKITLPYLPDAVVTVEDMLGKVPKLRYSDHDVCDAKNSQTWPRKPTW